MRTRCLGCKRPILISNGPRCARCKAKADAPYSTPEWREAREQAKQRDGFQCRSCGQTENLSVHHTTKVRRGGTHALAGLVTLCAVCHARWELDA